MASQGVPAWYQFGITPQEKNSSHALFNQIVLLQTNLAVQNLQSTTFAELLFVYIICLELTQIYIQTRDSL